MVKVLGGVEAVGLSLSNYRRPIRQNYDFCKYVNFLGNFVKIWYVFINTCLKFESKTPFAYM